MAVSGFKGFGWLLVGVIVSPGFYLVSSRVAAERGRLEAVERAIVSAQRDIRTLETEFGTRANFAQLERWNGDVLALAAPRPEQYAGGEAVLASLTLDRMTSVSLQTAALLVPSAIPEPVEILPDPAAVAVAPAAAVAKPRPAQQQPAPTRPIVAAVSTPSLAAAHVRRATPPKTQAVAMLDRKLLDDSTMGDLMRGARAEKAPSR